MHYPTITQKRHDNFLALFYDLMNPETGEITGHVDTYHGISDWDKAKIERGECSNQAYRIKKLFDHVEELIDDEEDPGYIKEQIAIIDKRYAGLKNYWNTKMEKYS